MQQTPTIITSIWSIREENLWSSKILKAFCEQSYKMATKLDDS